MLRIIQSTDEGAAKSYYTSGSRGDYYLSAQEMIGLWGGRAAERLGLSGQVTPEAFNRLCENRDPTTGERLTDRTKANRTVGYDFNFHAPKSVSVLYELFRDERILAAFRESVAETMQELERDVRARVRKRGVNEERVTGNLVWGEFVHRTARPVQGAPDPHLHIHNFVFNATFDAVEGKFKAGQFRELKRDAPYFEAEFHVRFAGRLQDLGYGIERTPQGWEIAGVPESVKEKFSRRTAQVEAEARRRGLTSAKDKDGLGARTRDAKLSELSVEELRREWMGRLTVDERTALRVAAKGTTPVHTKGVSSREAIEHGIQHSYERASVVEERQLLRTALRHGIGSVRVEDIRREFAGSGLLLREQDGRRFVTSKKVLHEERELLSFARNGRGTCRPLVGTKGQIERTYLSAEQQAAVRHVWQSPDRVIAIRGAAGVGKTTLMQEAVQGIERAGKRVYTFAPSAEASRGVLRGEGFKEAETVARLLQDTELQQEVRGQVLWIDEAGLLGSRSLHQVFQLAERTEARVVLSGDVRQHGSVERGDALRLMENYAGIVPAEVTEIRRQKGEYKAAVGDLSNGRTAKGFDRLDGLGMVIETPDDSRYQQLAEDYYRAVSSGKSVLVVSPTHAEGEHVTAILRERLRDAGQVGQEERVVLQLKSRSWTEAERQDAILYQKGDVVQFVQNTTGFRRGDRLVVAGVSEGEVWLDHSGEEVVLPRDRAKAFQVYTAEEIAISTGDRIRITQNGFTKDKKHRLNNGALYEVASVTRSGDLKLQNGWTVPRDFGHLAYGYCTTSHASQGKTVDQVFIAQSTESRGATSLEQFYVSASRGRERVAIYTNDKTALRDAIQDSSRRLSATELLETGNKPTAPWRQKAREQFERFRRYTRQVEMRSRDRDTLRATPARTSSQPNRPQERQRETVNEGR